MYLFDTNTIIYFLNASLPDAAMQWMNNAVDEHCNISTISKIELLGFKFKSIEEQKIMEAFVAGSIVFTIDDDIVNVAIKLRKIHTIKLPDAIIAATALVYDLTLLSRNIADFKNIKELKVINPWNQ